MCHLYRPNLSNIWYLKNHTSLFKTNKNLFLTKFQLKGTIKHLVNTYPMPLATRKLSQKPILNWKSKLFFDSDPLFKASLKGKRTNCLNFTHQKKPIETQITCFGTHNQSQLMLSLFTTLIQPLFFSSLKLGIKMKIYND